MNELMSLDLTNISFAALFVWLLVDTKKDSKQREEKYQETIDNLATNINIINDVKEDVEDIKNIMLGVNKNE